MSQSETGIVTDAEHYKKICGDRQCKEWFMRASIREAERRMRHIVQTKDKLVREDMTTLFKVNVAMSIAGVIFSYLLSKFPRRSV